MDEESIEEEASKEDPPIDHGASGAFAGGTSAAAAVTDTLSEACWAVGVLADAEASCPKELEGWRMHGGRMFVDGSASLASFGLSDADLPDVMKPFCLYSWASKGPATLPDEPPGALASMSLDCPVVEPAGNAFSSGLAPTLRTSFRAQVGASHDDGQFAVNPVTVALVDTSSELATAPQLEHAEALSAIVEDLACPNPNGCGVETLHGLALPLSEDGSHLDPQGGSYGTRAHVALGIMEAVAAWHDGIENGADATRLVINLSLGWVTPAASTSCGSSEDRPWCDDPEHSQAFLDYLDAPVEDFPTRASIEAVHAALMFASCNGAVIVASAGNTKEASCDQAPVAPATWAHYPAPTVDECETLGLVLDAANDLPGSLEQGSGSFVHPISALDMNLDPISATRPGTQTWLGAAGAHATVDSQYTPLTGTSVSAAAVSAAVALAWSQVPELSPAEVFEAVMMGARPLARPSEFDEFSVSAGSDVMMLSLCGMLEQLDMAYGGIALDGCVDPLPLGGIATMLEDAAYVEAESHPPEFEVAVDLAQLDGDACNVCGAPVDVLLGDLYSTQPYYLFGGCGTNPASFGFDAGPALAGPQPDVPVCPDCPAVFRSGSRYAYLSLDDEYRVSTVDITGASLSIQYPWGREIMDLNTVLGDVNELQQRSLVRINLPHSGGVIPSEITMKATFTEVGTSKPFHRSSPLLISGP